MYIYTYIYIYIYIPHTVLALRGSYFCCALLSHNPAFPFGHRLFRWLMLVANDVKPVLFLVYSDGESMFFFVYSGLSGWQTQ